jgi:hypothetical protein
MKYNYAAKLRFYDLKARKSFQTDKYKAVKKSGRNFVVATAPSGAASWRIVAKPKK